MFKRSILIAILTVTGMSMSFGQTFKTNHTFDLALSVGSSEFNGALSWNQIHGITKNKKFKLGYGVRLNMYSGSDKDYSTAPAELTSKTTGLGVMFAETFPENLDTFRVSSASMGSLNAVIHLEYALSPKFDIGFNIDAVGISFGKEVEGMMVSDMAPVGAELNQKAKPTAFNLLLTSDNDLGMLNSELYGRYRLNEKMGVRFGVTFQFTEYTTNNTIAYNFDNDRFRYKSLMGMAAFYYSPFK